MAFNKISTISVNVTIVNIIMYTFCETKLLFSPREHSKSKLFELKIIHFHVEKFIFIFYQDFKIQEDCCQKEVPL